MRKLIDRAAILAGLTAAPAAAVAQHEMGMPQHEVGVDLTAFYAKPSGASGNFNIGTPVDVRLGFVSKTPVSFETRFAFAFASGSGGARSSYAFTPDLNILWKLGKGMGMHNLMGPYATAGGGVLLTRIAGTSGARVSVNGGIGTRTAYESGAIRLEGFGRYNFKSTTLGLPNSFDIGARIGLSLWH